MPSDGEGREEIRISTTDKELYSNNYLAGPFLSLVGE